MRKITRSWSIMTSIIIAAMVLCCVPVTAHAEETDLTEITSVESEVMTEDDVLTENDPTVEQADAEKTDEIEEEKEDAAGSAEDDKEDEADANGSDTDEESDSVKADDSKEAEDNGNDEFAGNDTAVASVVFNGTEETFTDFRAAVNSWNQKGAGAKLVLLDDVEAVNTIEVLGGTEDAPMILDLNDHGILCTIIPDPIFISYGTIWVREGSFFELTDSSTTNSIRYVKLDTQGRGTEVVADEPGGGSYIQISGGYVAGGCYGGINNDGTFVMSGGEVCANSTEINRNFGGGVCNLGTFTMSGGKIHGNSGYRGGGVFNIGTFTMSGGLISANTADIGGGIFNHLTPGGILISGGEISGNTAVSGNALYNDNPAEVFYDSLKFDGRVIAGRAVDGSDAYSVASDKADGNVNSYGFIRISDLEVAAVKAGDTMRFFTDFGDAVDFWYEKGAGAKLTLLDDVETEHTLEVAGGTGGDPMTLDLGDHGILYKGSGNASVISVSNEGFFELTDGSGTKSTRYIKLDAQGRGNVVVSDEPDGGSYAQISGGYIAGGSAGGVYNAGSFTMSGGQISANTAGSGGGIYNAGSFTMSDGQISANTASDGNALFNDNGTISFIGDIVAGNAVDGTDAHTVTADAAERDVSNYGYICVYSDGVAAVRMGNQEWRFDDIADASDFWNEIGAGAELVLLKDVETDRVIDVLGGTGDVPMILDLNDHGILYKEAWYGVHVPAIRVWNGANFVLMDNSETETIRYIKLDESGRGTEVVSDEPDAVSYVQISGGYIAGGLGGGVFNHESFTMYGGTICGNVSIQGGGVYNGETFTMNGGEIRGNKAEEKGGGVFNIGTFTMGGGKICGNTTKFYGDVFNDYATVVIDGGVFAGSAADGTDACIVPADEARRKIDSYGFILIFKALVRAEDTTQIFTDFDPAVNFWNEKGAGAELVLMKNVETESTVEVGDGTEENPMVLDLNDHGILYKGTETDSVIAVGNGAYFELRGDGGTKTTRYIKLDDAGRATGVVLDEPGEGSYAQISGGFITGGTDGGIKNAGMTTMDGGTISGNTSENGGGVYNAANASFSMNEGNISENEAATNGGGVYNAGTFTVDDGELSGNAAASGGGVYNAANASFSMNGEKISENEATANGGGAYNAGTFTMDDVEISGNTAENGGGVFNAGSFMMRGGKINGNNASDATLGNAVFNSGTIDFNGVVIAGIAVDGTDAQKITAYEAKSNINSFGYIEIFEIAAVRIGDTEQGFKFFSDAVEFWNEKGAGATLLIFGDVETDATIEVSGGAAEAPMILDLNDHGILYKGTENASVITVGGGACFELRDGSITKSTRYLKLDEQGKGTEVVPDEPESGSSVQMTGGYIAGGSDGGVNNDGTFTLTGGAISGNIAGNGGGINNAGTFTMNGGLISGNTAENGSVYNTGTFTMNSGEISGNTSVNGGVYNTETFTMKGGEISGNIAENGGGVYSAGAFTMDDGEISGNTAENGGGLYNAGTFTMNGGQISGNNASDGKAVFNSNGTINFSGAIYAGTEIDGSDEQAVSSVEAKRDINTYGCIRVTICFALVRAENMEWYFEDFDGAVDSWNGKGAGAELVLLKDVETDSTIMVSGGTAEAPLILNLNDHGLLYKGTEEASVIIVSEGKSLELRDNGDTKTARYIKTNAQSRGTEVVPDEPEEGSFIQISGGYIAGGDNHGIFNSGTIIMNGGNISGNTGFSGGGLYNSNGASSTINSGKIYGNRATYGGGVYNTDGASFTMSGGEISGNRAGDGKAVFNGQVTTAFDGAVYAGTRTDGTDSHVVSAAEAEQDINSYGFIRVASGVAIVRSQGSEWCFEDFGSAADFWNEKGAGARAELVLLDDIEIRSKITVRNGTDAAPMILDLNDHGIMYLQGYGQTVDDCVVWVKTGKHFELRDNGSTKTTRYIKLDGYGRGIGVVSDEPEGGSYARISGGYLTGAKTSGLVNYNGAVRMSGGNIRGNIVGVQTYRGSFIMTGGSISGSYLEESVALYNDASDLSFRGKGILAGTAVDGADAHIVTAEEAIRNIDSYKFITAGITAAVSAEERLHPFTDFGEAVNFWNEKGAGAELALLDDVETDSKIEVSGGTKESPMILDLNDHGILYKGARETYVIGVNRGKSLELRDSGAVKTTRYVRFDTQGRGDDVFENKPSMASYVQISGGYIAGGTDGGIYNASNASFILSGGAISGNIASSGAGVFNDTDTSFIMKGGTICGNTATGKGGGVFNYGTFTMSGGEISRNNASSGSAMYNSHGTIVFDGGIFAGSASDGTDAHLVTADEAISDINNYGYITVGVATVRYGDTERCFADLGTAADYWNEKGAGAKLTLFNDVETDSTIEANGGTEGSPMTIDLNDHGILYKGDGNESVIRVLEEKYLELTDGSGTKSTRYIRLDAQRRGTEAVLDEPDGGLYVQVSGGYVAGGTCGGVNNAGTFKFSGGQICGNTSNTGGGVYNAGTVTLIGGVICNNTASSGSALFNDNGTILFSGGIFAGEAADGSDAYSPDADEAIRNISSYGFITTGTAVVRAGEEIRCFRIFNAAVNFWKGKGAGARLVLLSDVTRSSPISVNGGTEEAPMILDLNDHGILYNGNGNSGSFIGIGSGKHFELVDGSTAKTTRYIRINSQGRGDKVLNDKPSNSSYVQISGGYLTGGVSFGGVNNAGMFTMNGGTICGNIANSGGGVYNSADSSFIMNGGLIYRNKASAIGGGVYNRGTFTMNDGEISSNAAGEGGGVGNYGTDASFTLTGGKLSGNTATDGGGVYNRGTFTMAGGEISGNSATKGGGVSNLRSFTMTGGEISENTATTSGGGIWNSGADAKFKMRGGEISRNTVDSSEGNALYNSEGTIEFDGEVCAGRAIDGTGADFVTAEVAIRDVNSYGFFTILSLWYDPVEDMTYTGSAIIPAVRVYFGGMLLKEKTDYTISFKNNTNAGTATFTVTGKGNYSGKADGEFSIVRKSIEDPDLTVAEIAPKAEGRTAYKPVPSMTYNKKKLASPKDFTVTYYDQSRTQTVAAPTEAGHYRAVAEGKGNYTGTLDFEFVITRAGQILVSKLTVGRIPDQPYDSGNPVKPPLTVKNGTKQVEDGCYAVTYSSNTEIGTASATVTGIEDKGYVGSKTVTFKIVGTALSKAKVVDTDFVKAYEYSGTERKNFITLLEKKNAQDAGTPLTGMEKEEYDRLADGSAEKRAVDYVITYEKNINAGNATMLMTGVNGWTGTVKKAFKIDKFNIKNNPGGKFAVTLDKLTYPYAKAGVKPKPEVKFNGKLLAEGTDYTLAYSNNTAVGGAKPPTVKVTGKGNFTGADDSTTFSIEKANLAAAGITVTAKDVVWADKNGNYKTTVTVTDSDGKKLTANTDYILTFSKNPSGTPELGKDDRVGEGTTVYAIITHSDKPKCGYEGSVSGAYRVCANDIGKLTAKAADKIFTGRPVTITGDDITWKAGAAPKNLTEGADFEIVKDSYEKNTNKGTASVIVKGIGEYGGTKKVTFNIKTKNVSWWKSLLNNLLGRF
ncbi:MAG: hypothetical protein K6F73_02510 [Lachnospiraceae bacterium]|nr:hypothetical protein [Lachnospiraceae bacterium]